jgi:ligand-binding sensor domain-containing protein
LPEAYIKEIIRDDEGNIWFASQSNGIAILRDQAFTFYDYEQDKEIPEISAISMVGNNYWFGRDDELDAALILSGHVDHQQNGRYCFQTTYINECFREYFEACSS